MKQTPKEYADELELQFSLIGLNQRDEGLQGAIKCVEKIIEANPNYVKVDGYLLSGREFFTQVLTELKTKTD